MDLKLVTSPINQNTATTPATSSFVRTSAAAEVVFSPKASSAPVKSAATSFFGIPRMDPSAAAGVDEDLAHIDPDELFVRYSVAQVKSLAAKLSADADAKQEELRLMVGERYRDLLEASTSIIDMASASRAVLDGINDMRTSCSEKDIHRTRVAAPSSSDSDSQLKTLQSLAAHMKLLLDCPEQFWKLIERRQYLDAAWLFLVASVVHQSLVEEDEDDGWAAQGIAVSEQFPLVQRQWDAIHSFKAQITHKATQSLREDLTNQETMDAILCLVLLDSRSLNSTLDELLSQRSKAINTFLSNGMNKFKQDIIDQDTTEIPPRKGRRRKVREVRAMLSRAVNIVSETVHKARYIYSHGNSGAASSIEAFLNDMHAEAGLSPFSTSKILGALPSASLLDLYLPTFIKSYTPSIDASGPSFKLSDASLNLKLDQWFNKALDLLVGKLHEWVGLLHHVADVAEVRRVVISSAIVQHLTETERNSLARHVGEVCEGRMISIWKEAFTSLRDDFESGLLNASKLVRASDPSAKNGESEPGLGTLLVIFTFSPLRKRFETAVEQRKNGRTPLLQSVVSVMENGISALENELAKMSTSDNLPVGSLGSQFRELEDQLYKDIATLLQKGLESSGKSEVDRSVLIGRIADSLRHSSIFKMETSSDATITDLKTLLSTVHEKSLSAWQGHLISQITAQTGSIFQARPVQSVEPDQLPVYTRPSGALLDSLYMLQSASQLLGLDHNRIRDMAILNPILESWLAVGLPKVEPESLTLDTAFSRLIWDLHFLQHLCNHLRIQSGITTALDQVTKRLNELSTAKHAQTFLTGTQTAVSQSIPRLQVLLPLLLSGDVSDGANTSSLLIRGVPVAEVATTSPIEVAKPCPRFGLLLIGSTGKPLVR
ncbi:hypothetical protein PIIN_01516 [Serendipita indica DSM 11827]|uniref:Conserved oligomeric Golgi complex subunit 1 n=1 Tax=Serendipita indica (strain DSM 11827) TaxID=1109443 RepID=G4T8N7_SERID|nr:hypothetical protein PIIN_01516 [Serendipita indica DSM 11827]